MITEDEWKEFEEREYFDLLCDDFHDSYLAGLPDFRYYWDWLLFDKEQFNTIAHRTWKKKSWKKKSKPLLRGS